MCLISLLVSYCLKYEKEDLWDTGTNIWTFHPKYIENKITALWWFPLKLIEKKHKYKIKLNDSIMNKMKMKVVSKNETES